jgi:hypothetical protein
MARTLATPAIRFPLQGQRVRIDSPDHTGASPIIRLADSERVGHLSLETAATTLIVRELCIDQPHRSYGCGSESGWLIVRAAEAAGYDLVRAWAPPNLGLAVYFWFRMGLHPLHGEGPNKGIWLERRLRPGA